MMEQQAKQAAGSLAFGGITMAAVATGGLALAGLSLGALVGIGVTNQIKDFRLHEVTVKLPAPDPNQPGQIRPRLPRPVRILHVSDLHMLVSQTEKQEFVASLAELQPDLVINTGDNLGEAEAVPAVLQALDPLLNFPGLFCFGSNDYYAPRPVNPFIYLLGKKRKPSKIDLPWQDMRAAFIERGWEDTTHRRVEFQCNGINIAAAGVDDPHLNRAKYSEIAGQPNPDAHLAIGLTHSPEPEILHNFAADGYDLTLAGHTHGGQICLPGQRAIVTNCGIDRRRASGLSDFDGMALHVSNGLGTSKYAPVRLFCAPSATLITVLPAE